MYRVPFLLLVVLAGCSDRPRPNPACGIAAVAAPTAVLGEFTRPQRTLSEAPRRLPEVTVARVVAGPAFRAILGRADTGLVVGVDGQVPPGIVPSYGVLVTAPGGNTQGVLIYEGLIIEAAPRLGIVSYGGLTLPLIGVEVDTAMVLHPGCPLFPDSLLQ